MAIFNIFSKRMKAERGEMPDVYQYDKFEYALRVKISHIIFDSIGKTQLSEPMYKKIIDALCHEYGVFELVEHSDRLYSRDHLIKYFIAETDIEKALDVVELSFQTIDVKIRKQPSHYQSMNLTRLLPDEAISDLNSRFKEDGFGFRYESGQIIKISSEYTHNEIIKPALKILSDKRFKGAQEEFLSAHRHYRDNEKEECINDCLKSFESSMKIICKIKKIQVAESATAKALISALFENDYIPKYLQSHCNALQSMLESGVPVIRNKTGAHGQGETIRVTDDSIVEFTLNTTASNIVFLTSFLDTKGVKA